MPAIARGQSSDRTNPAFNLFTPVRGALVDPAEVAFQIFDVSDDGKRAAPVQVFPSGPDTRAPANTAEPWPAVTRSALGASWRAGPLRLTRRSARRAALVRSRRPG